MLGAGAKDDCKIKEWNNFATEHDTRYCYLCLKYGDNEVSGRLLPVDLYWVHANCILWSQEIYADEHLIEQIQLNVPKMKSCVSSA